MTEHEKKLIQARHRLEEAQMRNRDKERKARTMTTDELEEYLCSTLRTK